MYQHIYSQLSKIKNTLWSDSKTIQHIFTNMAFLLSLSIGHKVQDLCDIYVSFYTLKVENNKNFPRSHCQLSKLTFWNRLFISNSHGGETTSWMKIGLKKATSNVWKRKYFDLGESDYLQFDKGEAGWVDYDKWWFGSLCV